MEANRYPAMIPLDFPTFKKVESYHQSEGSLDRHLWIRVCVMELFLRILFQGVKEALSIAMVPLTALKLGLDSVGLGRFSPRSMPFGEIAAHLKQSIQCAAALVFDFPGLFIDPGPENVQARLASRHLVDTKAAQLKLNPFESLPKYHWASKVVMIGALAAAVLTTLAFQRISQVKDGVNLTIVSGQDSIAGIGKTACGLITAALCLVGYIIKTSCSTSGNKQKEGQKRYVSLDSLDDGIGKHSQKKIPESDSEITFPDPDLDVDLNEQLFVDKSKRRMWLDIFWNWVCSKKNS